MTRKALEERENKRSKLVKKYATKRASLLQIIKDPNSNAQDRFLANVSLQKIPRNAAPSRQRNRCALTGRPRGVFRRFGLGRSKLRELAMSGQLPGVIKSSW